MPVLVEVGRDLCDIDQRLLRVLGLIARGEAAGSLVDDLLVPLSQVLVDLKDLIDLLSSRAD